MKSQRSLTTVIIILTIGFALVMMCAPAWRVSRAAAQPDAQVAVREAWQRAEKVGAYRFSTDIEQTTYPAPMVANVGRSSHTETYHLDGAVNRRAESLSLTIWQNSGNLLTGQDGFEIRVRDGKAYGRPIGGGTWQQIDDFNGTFAPANDPLAYLAGAKNLRPLSPEDAPESVRGYAFDLDGPAFASSLRSRLEDQLRRSGELPPGLSLDTPGAYRAMSGEGELWLDAEGLPLRLHINIAFPDPQSGERVTADIRTDFSGFQEEAVQGLAFWQNPGGWITAALHLPLSSRGRIRLFPKIGLGLLGFALLMLFVHYRHTRHAYAAFVGVILFSMVVTPLLHSYQVAAYYDRQGAKAAEAQAREAAQSAARQAQEDLLTPDWNPRQNPLESGQPLADSGPSSAVNRPQAAAPSPDADLDGLSDEIETGILGTSPDNPDSDGDGLDDGVEALRLGTNPLKQDSDGDQILDAVEVRGFLYRGQMWYLDPNAADSNGDGRLDTQECPALLGNAVDPDAVCPDQDNDGVPDIFDRDDDGEGLPDRIDFYPDGLLDRHGRNTTGQNIAYFDRDNPFRLQIDELQSNQPVFVDFQIVPKEREHLTYALNVLDWPDTDTDGQVQHVKPTTFASSMTAAQIQGNPSAANGDMRLIPMLEIVMSGDKVPLRLTTPEAEVSLQGAISATIHLDEAPGNNEHTRLTFTFDDSGNYTAKLYRSGCPASGAPLETYTVSNQQGAVYNGNIVDLVDSQHAIVVSHGSDAVCAPLGNIVNGPYRHKMVDMTDLTPYGISVREIDSAGTLAAYVPVNMVPVESGYGRAAFAARMVYWEDGDAAWAQAQEVRLVWMVQMLTDQCDSDGFEAYWDSRVADDAALEGDDAARNDAFQTWCASPAHRTPDVTQVVQTYDDEWMLTGFTVREDHGLDTAIIYEDPVNGDVVNSDNLFQAALALSSVFVGGRNLGGKYRDVGVYIQGPDGQKTADTNIYNRLDADSNKFPDGDSHRWGIPKGALQVERERYPHQDYSAYQAMYATPDILNQFSRDVVPTLLFARDEYFRSSDLGSLSEPQNGVFTLDMDPAAHPEQVIAGLRWMPYRYNDVSGSWEPYPADAYWDVLEVQYADRFEQLDTRHEYDAETYLGQAIVARAYYFSLLQGLTQEVQFGPKVLSTVTPAESRDSAIIDVSVGYATAVEGLVRSLTSEFLEEYGGWGRFLQTVFGKYNQGHSDVYEEYSGFWSSIGKSVRANTIGPWAELFSGGYKAKFGVGIALAGGVAAIGLTLYGISQTSNGLSAAQTALVGLGVVMAVQDMVSAVKEISQALSEFGTLGKAMLGEADSIMANAKSSISKAAVVGLVIGVAVTWAMVGVQLGLMGANGGLSGMAVANVIAGAIASTIVAVIMFAIAAIPVVGQIIAAIIGLIDALVNLLCSIFVPEDQAENPAVSWFCGGITGMFTKLFQVLIYSGNEMVSLYPEDVDYTRLAFSNFESDDLVHPDWGIRQGNSIRYGVSLTNTIDLTPRPDNLGGAYWYQYNDEVLRSSTFDYQLSYTNTVELHEGLDRKTMLNEWRYLDGDGPEWGDFGHTWHAAEPVFVERTLKSTGIALQQAGINLPSTLYLNEGYALPSQNCILGVCTIWTERGTEHHDLGNSVILDVFPATLSAFYELTAKENGYALAWGQSGDVTFPRLQDADGDGIPYTVDQHDNAWDNDFDGLSDGDEARLGTNPNDADSDGDGLRDDLELVVGTNPLRPDSDGDGLLDGEEVFHQDIFDQDGDGDRTEWLGGWMFVYDLTEDGVPLQTRVFPSPLNNDTDSDSLGDYQEKVYGLNPCWISNPHVLTFESSVYEAGGGTLTPSDGFVRPGDSLFYDAALRNELYNRWLHGLLETDIPAPLGNSSIDPVSFLLYPQETQLISGAVQVASNAPAGVYTLTQTASALVSDWAELAQDAALWYPFEDDVGVSTFSDHSGSIPPHDADCSNPAGCTLDKGDDNAFGGAISLNGSAYLTTDYEPSNAEFSVAFWFKTTQGNGGLFQTRGAGESLRIYLQGGRVYVKTVSNKTFTLSTSGAYNDGRWHHLVYAYGTTLNGQPNRWQRLYLNGVIIRQDGYPAFQSPLGNTRIGYANGHANFIGQIDEFRIYAKGLTAPEVRALFDAPVLDLRFDSDANWKDSSIFRNDVTCTTCPSHSGGVSGKAAAFGGSAYLDVGPGASLRLGGGQFTIGMWIFPGSSPKYCSQRASIDSEDCAIQQHQPQGLFGFGSDTAQTYPTLQRVGNKLRFTFGDNPYVTTGDVLQPGHWNHVVVTFDGSVLQIYVNGQAVLQDSTTFQGETPPAGSRLSIGRTSTHASFSVRDIWVGNVGEGENTGEFCMAIKAGNSPWHEVFYESIQEGRGAKDDPGAWVSIDSPPFTFSGRAQVLMWEEDNTADSKKCITNDNKNDDDPRNRIDDPLGDWTFTTNEVSQGSEGNNRLNSVLASFSGNNGRTYGDFSYVYHNDSIPFRGEMDEVLVYNRPLSEAEVAGLYQQYTHALHLKLDDAPGATTFDDASFANRQGTCNRVNADCPTAGVPGRVNQAAFFDGNDAVNLKQSELNRLNAPLTVAVWARPEDLNGLQWLAASARTHSANGYGLALDGDRLRFQVFGKHTYTSDPLGLMPGTWVHLAVTLSANGTLRFYRDGAQVGGDVTGVAAITPDSDDDFLIGAGTPTGQANRSDYFSGALDDLHIYSRVLSPGEIRTLKNRAPIVQLSLDEAVPIPGTASYEFPDSADPAHSAGCPDAAHCPQAGFAVDGQIDTAAAFDGVNDALTYLYRPAIDADDFTLTVWVFPAEIRNQPQTLITLGYPNVNYGLFIQPNAMTPVFITGDSNCNQQVLEAENDLLQNQWNHIAAVRQGSQMFIYVNGYLQGERDIGGGKCGGGSWLTIGGGFSGSDGAAFFAGRLDELTYYDYALDADAISEIFATQSKWVQERQQHPLTVDTDSPQVSLDTTGEHLPLTDVQMLIHASDATSGVARVEFGVRAPGAGDYTWMDAPHCQDAPPDAGAWCPTFNPARAGTYDLRARVTDAVGHRSTLTGQVVVEDSPPDAAFDFAAGDLFTVRQSDAAPMEWLLTLSGTVGDPAGVDADNLMVALYDEHGSLVPPGAQRASLAGNNWSLTYRMTLPQAGGIYTVTLTAPDAIAARPGLAESQKARHTRVLEGVIQVDGTPPEAFLSLPPADTLHASQVLTGTVTEAPVPLVISYTTDENADELSVRLTCGGLRRYEVAAEQLPALDPGATATRIWRGAAPRGAACTLEVADTGGDGGTFGAVQVCGSEVAAWDSDFGSRLALPFTADSAACPPAVDAAGVESVEAAFRSVLPGSVFYDPPQAAGQILHLPLDETPASTGELTFRDISGQGGTGTCKDDCPAAAQPGRVGNAVAFEAGTHVVINQDEDRGARSGLTLALWVQPRGGDHGAILFKEGEFGLLRDPVSGEIRWTLGNSTFATGSVLPSGEWAHLAMTWDGAQLRAYVNGEAVYTASAAPAVPDRQPLWIASTPQGDYYNGLLDDLQIFDRALDAAEIRALYIGDAPVLHLTFEKNWLSDGMTLADASDWEQNGTLFSGAADPLNKATPHSAVGASALKLDGVDDYALVPDSPALDLAQFGLSLWANASISNAPVLFKGSADMQQVNYGLFYDPLNGLVSLYLGDAACTGSTRFQASLGGVATGDWHHLAASYDGAAVVLYFDGREILRQAYTGGVCQNDEPLRIAQSLQMGGGNTAFFHGLLDDILIYPRPLSAEEVGTLYARGWQPATVSDSGSGVVSATWALTVPANLEGAYRLDLRAWDVGGRVSAPQTAWQGEVDTLAPRLSMTSELLGDTVRYTAAAGDFNLDPDSLTTPCGAGRPDTSGAFSADWYRSAYGFLPRVDEARAICEQPVTTLPGIVGAYDTPGLAYGVDVSGTVAYLADGNGGLRIVDVSNPNNPQETASLEVGYLGAVEVATGGPVLSPDLTVTGLEASPATPSVGAGFTLSVTVENQGVGGVYNADVALYQDAPPAPCQAAPPLWTATIPYLAPGQSAVVAFSHPGLSDIYTHLFYAQADSACAVDESDEDNNIFEGVPIHAIQPDLTVDSVTFAPRVIAVNDPFSVTVVIRNRGSETAYTFNTAIYTGTASFNCGDVGWASDSVSALAPGEVMTFTHTYPGFSAAGQYDFLGGVDTNCAVEESNEFNNDRQDTVTIQPPGVMDLVITHLDVVTTILVISQPFVVTATVYNQGTALAGAFDTAVYSDTAPAGCGDPSYWATARLPGLDTATAAVLTYTLPGFDAYGWHTLTAYADSSCEVGETEEGNNASDTRYFWVGDANPADLVVTVITTPLNITVGQTYVVTTAVRNQGTGTAVSRGSFIKLAYRVDSPPPAGACEFSTDARSNYEGVIPPGGTVIYTTTLPAPLSAGTSTLYAYADYECWVLESDESNNTLSTTVTIQNLRSPGPDLSGVPAPEVFLRPVEGIPAAPAAQPLYAYLAAGATGLRIVDVSDPAAPAPVSTLAFPSPARDVRVQGDYAYLTSYGGEVYIADISNPGFPGLLGSLTVPGDPRGLDVSGNYAYVASGSGGLHILDVSNPAAPSPVASYVLSGYPVYDVAVSGNYAYLAGFYRGLQILDVSDPTNPVPVGSFTGSSFNAVTVLDDRAYLAGGQSGLLVMDVSDPAHPVPVQRFDTPDYVKDLAVAAGDPILVYLADNESGLQVINAGGTPPTATACDTFGNCASTQTTRSYADLAAEYRSAHPGAELRYPLAGDPLEVKITAPPAVLDSLAPITVTGYASATLSTLEALTLTVDGAPLAVTGWQSGTTYSNWQAAWTPATDGGYLLQAEVRAADGSTVSDTLTVTVDTLPPTVTVSPTLYVGADYFEPRSINLRGAVGDIGGVTQVEVLGLDGVWRTASLHGDTWNIPWGLATTRLPDNETRTVQVRATDIAGHTTTIEETLTVDALPPAPMELTLTADGVPVQDGDLLPAPAADLTLSWTPSADGSGLAPAYRVRWTVQVTATVSQTWQTVPAGGTLAANFTAYEGQRIAVGVGITDTAGNLRWQEWGTLLVDSPLTPDFLTLPSPLGGGAGGGGCTYLGADRRPERRIYGGETQSLYATWNREALQLAWLGGDWDGDGDLFLYFDTAAGGMNTAYNPFGGAETVTLPEGMLADALVWVQGRTQAQLLRWDGGQWVVSGQVSGTSSQVSAGSGQASTLTTLTLPFADLGLTAGGPLSLVGFATEEGALRLWATLPGSNPLDSALLSGVEPVGTALTLLHAYHWPAVGDGVCPNAAYPDADLEISIAAQPEGIGYRLLGDGLYWLRDTLLNNPPADVSSQIPSLPDVALPLPNTAIVTCTLTFRNRGTVTATGVTADITSDFSLALLDGDPDGQTRLIGEVPPGEVVTYTFRGQIDTARSEQPWGRAALQIFDAAHPAGGAPLEYLWLDQRVDRQGPRFFGASQPDYLVGAGENSLAGYAYDEAGVLSLEAEIQGPQGTQTLTCPTDDPAAGSWRCAWEVSGDNGDLFSLRLRTTDGNQQPGEWGPPQTFLLDNQPPTVTLDISTTQILSNSVVNRLDTALYGTVSDNGGLGTVEVCLEEDCRPASLQLEAGETPLRMEDAPDGGIPINSGSACGAGTILRTFEVTRTFTVREIQLGFAALHTHRDDLLVTLTAPSGVSVTLLSDDGVSGSDFANADFWLDDAAPAALADIQNDLRLQTGNDTRPVRPVSPLRALTGIPAAGTWTLAICDTNPGADDGTYLHSTLLLVPQERHPKAGTWSASVSSGDRSLDYVPQSVAVFGEDVVGNRRGVTMTVTVDNVPPVITVTQVISSGYLGDAGRVLGGEIHDGGPSVSVWVDVQQPDGSAYRTQAARAGDGWYFEMDYDLLGTYVLWVTARDLAGNTVSTDAYLLTVTERPTVYLPVIFQNYASPVVYDFENGAGEGWSSPTLETAPNGEVFLGPFNNDDLTLTLENLPPHSAVTIAFDLYIIRSWDGNQEIWPVTSQAMQLPWAVDEVVGPDIWEFRMGEAVLLHTTFSNWTSLGFRQAYPDEYPDGDFPAQTGAVAVNTLGYTFGGIPMDATYHLTFTVPHTGSTFESGFSAAGLQIGEDESWGLDNVTVTLEP